MDATPHGAESPLAPGAPLGRYVITRHLGGGAMGQVYEARHSDLDKRVAIKVMDASTGSSQELRARFIREGQAAARVRHPHAVDISDVGAEGDLLYLVMEYLEGEDLAALLEREAPLPVERVADLMLPVVSALADVHHEGIVHRDLKPANIFLARTRHGELHPKVLDFGVSKVNDPMGGQALTGSAALLGTPVYMSPEQTRGSRNVDARSDIYSLGTILYECATGKRSVTSGNIMVIFQRISEGVFAPPRSIVPTIPAGFEALILRTMALDPEDRFASMDALGRALVPFATPAARVRWGSTFGADLAPASIEEALRSSQPPSQSPVAQSLPPAPTAPLSSSPSWTPSPAPPTSPSVTTSPSITTSSIVPKGPSKLVWGAAGALALAVGALGFVAALQYLNAGDVATARSRPPRRAPGVFIDAGRSQRDAAIAAPDREPPVDAPEPTGDVSGAVATPDEPPEETGRHHHRSHDDAGAHHHHRSHEAP